MPLQRASLVFALLGAALVGTSALDAADHNDPPARTDPTVSAAGADRAADIADLYAWVSGDPGDPGRRLVIAMTFSGPNPPVVGQDGHYDRDVLYGIHLDNDATPGTPEHDIWIRFGEDDGAWGVQISGIPGITGNIVGAVETELTRDGARAWVGLRDDPFFFDLEGFQDTLMTGAPAFVSTRDFFAGKNLTAVVLELALDDALDDGTGLEIWATSARLTE